MGHRLFPCVMPYLGLESIESVINDQKAHNWLQMGSSCWKSTSGTHTCFRQKEKCLVLHLSPAPVVFDQREQTILQSQIHNDDASLL